MGDTKYGWLRGDIHGAINLPLKSGEEINGEKSGRFCTVDSSGRIVMATATDSALYGYVESGTILSSANTSDGLFNLKVITSRDAVFRIPVTTGTYAASMKGKTCDLVVTSASPDVMGANLSASDYDVVVIVDGDLDNNAYVDVMLARPGFSYTGVV